MASHSVPGPPLSRNDVYRLADLLEIAFQDHIDHHYGHFKEYLRSLRMVVGLGFTVTLEHDSMFCVYSMYLKRFLAGDAGNFKKNPRNCTVIAQSTANMVRTAANFFVLAKLPGYYDDFLAALKFVLVKRPYWPGEQPAVEGLLKRLTPV